MGALGCELPRLDELLSDAGMAVGHLRQGGVQSPSLGIAAPGSVLSVTGLPVTRTPSEGKRQCGVEVGGAPGSTQGEEGVA